MNIKKQKQNLYIMDIKYEEKRKSLIIIGNQKKTKKKNT